MPLRSGVLLLHDFFFVALLLALALAGSGCATFRVFAPEEGRVLDLETGHPLVGAAVVVEYFTVTGTIAGTVPSRAAIAETKTDTSGLYSFEWRFVLHPRLPISWFVGDPTLHVFCPGYEAVRLRGPIINGPLHLSESTGQRGPGRAWVLYLARTPDVKSRKRTHSMASSLWRPEDASTRKKCYYYFELLDHERRDIKNCE